MRFIKDVDLISKTYTDIASGKKCKLVNFNHPTPVWWQLSYLRNAFEYLDVIVKNF